MRIEFDGSVVGLTTCVIIGMLLFFTLFMKGCEYDHEIQMDRQHHEQHENH